MIEMIGYGALVPGAVSVAAVFLCRRVFTESAATRYAAAVAVLLGFVVGYALLPSWATFVPERHWHWLPWLAAAAAMLGPVSLAEGVSAIERWLLYFMLSLAAAFLLVPDWSSLTPSRPVWIAILSGYLFVLTVLLEALATRVTTKLLLVFLALAGVLAAALVATEVSVRYGRVAALAAASLAGGVVADWRRADSITPRALTPAFVVLVGGGAFVGAVEPEPPRVDLLLAPALPLALWLCAWGPLSRRQD